MATPRLDYWTITSTFPASDWDALRVAVPAASLPLTIGYTSGTEVGTVSATIPAGSREEATARFGELYAEARNAANLPADTHEPVAFDAPAEEPLHRRLLKDAARLYRVGLFALAVVRAQTAVEVYAKDAFGRAFAARLGPDVGAIANGICSWSLRNKQTRGTVAIALGECYDAEEWWGAYSDHLSRRDLIVHAGLDVTKEDCEASMSAVGACVRWLAAVADD